MKILACVKACPDWDKVLPEDWSAFAPEQDIAYAGRVFNCFDEAALEHALRLKEQAMEAGEDCSCHAVTVGSLPERLAETLFAAGFDGVTVLAAPAEFNSKAVAGLLADFAAGYDIIITGSQAGRADTGTVPLWLAASLQRDPLAEVCDIALHPQGLRIQQQADGLWERVISVPALLIVGDSPAVLRAVSLRDRLQAKGREAEIIPMHCGDAPIPQLMLPKPGRQCVMLPDAPIQELAQLLLSEHLCDTGTASHRESDFTTDGKHSVIKYNAPGIYPDTIKALVQDYAQRRPDCAIFPDTVAGRMLAMAVARADNCAYATGAHRLELGDKATLYKRVCSSNLIWQQQHAYPLICTFSGVAEVQAVELPFGGKPRWLLEEKLLQPPCPSDLDNAKLVIVCGAGMGSKANCDLARKLAAKLGAGFGLSRPAALNGWGGVAEIVGQSGSSIAPACCLALGVAGAGAFMAGMEGVGKVIAVNTDERALIFRNADIGIAADAPSLVTALLEEV